ncbi:acid-sensing ion channel 1C-like [Diadema antillarum]|uniref:acid-sensing ion channel 1C-like n=1 Tax=Diadema antillarum TaxID=105358 RepID=UPI003A8C748D
MSVKTVDHRGVGLDSKQPGIRTDEATVSPPPYARYHDKVLVSWFAIFYKAIPEAVGLAGIKYAFNPAEVRTRRLFWLFLVLSAMGVTGYQLIDRSFYFASNPKSVDISVDYDKEKDFPSVAICNYNSFRAEMVIGTRFGDFLEELSLDPSNINMTAYQPALGVLQNMTGLFVNMSHTLESTLVLGSWGQESLTAANFTLRVTDWGVCFVFNDESNGLPKLTLRAAGRRYSLRLTLDAQQFDYFFEPKGRGSAGFQVVLYDYGTEPSIEDSGFGIAPGEMTLAAVDVIEYTNLPPPHGQCGEKVLKYYDYYGHTECYNECSEDFIRGECGCKTLAMKGVDRECTAWEFFNCTAPVYYYFLDNAEELCDCPPACSRRTYSASVSHVEYPSTFWTQPLSAFYNLDSTYFKENVCGLTVFFKDKTVQRIRQRKVYDFFSLLCDIGGSLGLWLGGSILTLFEIVDAIGHSAYVYSRTQPQQKNKTPVHR